MSCDEKKGSAAGSVVRLLAPLALALAVFAPAARAVDSGDIVVAGLKGDVHVTMQGVVRNVRIGSVLELPATVRTGANGAIELKQGMTTVSVGPETLLEFPALEKRGAPIDRIVQPRGNVFYDIGKRGGRRLRIETPYLVGVVKGTQFNIAAQDGATTISLFEGLLEVRASDDSEVIDLVAGEIASRGRAAPSIDVLKMDTPPAKPHPPTGNSEFTPVPSAPHVAASHVVAPDAPADAVDARLVDRDFPAEAPGISNAGAAVNLGNTVSTTPDIATNTVADVGAADVGVAAAPDVASGARVGDIAADSAAVGTSVDTGPATVDVSTATNVDTTAGTVDVATSTSADVGAGTIDLDTSANVNVGGAAVDVDNSVNVDSGAGTVDVTTETSVDAGPLTTDVGANSGVDAGAGAVDAGASVAGTDLGVSLDLGLGEDDIAAETETADTTADTDTNTDTVVDTGGVLDDLLNRRERR
jgi:hypothetical protein